MGKIKVSKKIYKAIEVSKKQFNTLDTIKFLALHVNFTQEESILAIKAYLNEDGYEVERTPEELAVEKYKEKCISLKHEHVAVRCYSDGFNTAMKWMNKNFNLGIDFQDK